MRAELRGHAGEKPWAPARPIQLHWLRSRGAHLVWQIRLHALAGFRPEAPDKRAFVSGAHCTDITMAFALIIRGLQATGKTSLRSLCLNEAGTRLGQVVRGAGCASSNARRPDRPSAPRGRDSLDPRGRNFSFRRQLVPRIPRQPEFPHAREAQDGSASVCSLHQGVDRTHDERLCPNGRRSPQGELRVKR